MKVKSCMAMGAGLLTAQLLAAEPPNVVFVLIDDLSH